MLLAGSSDVGDFDGGAIEDDIPMGYGFHGDPEQGYATMPSPFEMSDSNGKVYDEEENDKNFFDGPVLSESEHMRDSGRRGLLLRSVGVTPMNGSG